MVQIFLLSGLTPLDAYLCAKRYVISSFLTELLDFGAVMSQMQKLGVGLLYKTSFGRVSVSNNRLAHWGLAASQNVQGWKGPLWVISSNPCRSILQFLQLFVLMARATPLRIGTKQTATGISRFLSSPASLCVFCVFLGRFFERLTGLQQKQLQQIPCGLCM